MNCKDCCQDCQRIGCDIELGCSGYVEPSNGTKERMDKRLAMMYRLYTESEEKHIFTPSEPITNADHIRSMGDIELANFLSSLTMCGCVNCPMYYPEENDECVKNCNSAWQEWVKQESEEK